jgi:signal transduction histidine kinase/ligand-binding sensor domain-containing protein
MLRPPIRPSVLLRAFAAVGLVLALGAAGRAAGPSALPGFAAVKVFKEEPEGLPHLTVTAMARDRAGRLWAGTHAGVARFDGERWLTVAAPPSNYVLQVNANAMTGMADGSMWIGTRFQGILEYREGRWKVHDTTTGLPNNNINAVVEGSRRDASGRPVIWAATYGKGLACYEDGVWRKAPGGLPSEKLYCLLERNGALWAGTASGVWVMDQGRWRPFEGNAALETFTVRAMAETTDPEGNRCVWFGTDKDGLYRWRRGVLEAMPLQSKMGCASVRSLLAAPGGAVYVATDGGGLARIVEDRWEVENTRGGLMSDSICCLALTPRGPAGTTLWAGSNGQGIFRLPGCGWRSFKVPWPAPDPKVQTFAETRDPATGRTALWMGNTYLARLEDGKWTFFRPDPSSNGTPLRSLFAFPGGQDLYFGFRENLGWFHGGRFTYFRPQDGMPGGLVRAVTGVVGAKGGRVLWIGTSRGLARWDGSRFRVLPPPPGDPEPSIRTLVVDGERLWVGTDRGLACLEKEAWVMPRALRGFLQVGVEAILPVTPKYLVDQPGILVGTFGSGLRFLEDVDHQGEALAFSTATTPALHHDQIYDLVPDALGRIYVAGPRGVARVDPDRGWSWDDFTREDGLPGTQCLQGSLFRDSAGRIWVGTEDGPAWLDPQESFQDRAAKPLVWEGASVQGRLLDPGATLSHRDQGLRFEFRLLSDHREEDTRFRTRLEGLQDAPGPWTSQSFVQFPTLPPGRYTLYVWARDFAGNESGPLAFPFRILTAPWNRPWAWALYTVLLGASIYGLLVLRTNLLAQRNRELERTIRDATEEILQQREEQEALNRELIQLNLEKTQFMGIAAHDLRSPLNTIVLVADGLLNGDLQACPPEVLPWLRKVAASAHYMTSLIAEFLDVNALDSGRFRPTPRPVSVGEALGALTSLFQLRLEAKHQTLSVEQAPGSPWVRVDPNHLRQVLDNLLSNASKFSPPGAALKVGVVADGPVTRFVVADQGPGIRDEDQEKLFRRFAKLSARPTGGETSSGLGLSIVKQLVDANHGRIWAENLPEGGCAFIVEVPSSEAPGEALA